MKTGEAAPLPAVLLLAGPERWLRDQVVLELKARCLAAGFEEMDLTHFQEPPGDPRAILEAAKASPFGSPLRLVVVAGFDELDEKAVPWLGAYLERPNPKACVALCAEKLDEKLAGAFAGKPGRLQVKWCQTLKGRELTDWVAARAQAAGTPIEPDAAALLVTRVGSELQALATALEGLGLLAERRKIGIADIDALIPPSMRETAFDILDTAGSGKPEIAIAQLRQAIAQNQITVENFMGALGWYYRMAWKSRGRPASGPWMSPQRQAALARLSRWPAARLRAAMDEVLRADVGLKLSHPAPELAADQLLLKLGS